MDLDASVREGDILATKYEVERVLGRGGMGIVVAAHHVHLGSRVALKFMLPTAAQQPGMRERFVREARAAGRLRGEHVARIMDFGMLDNGAPYIVMEFLEGSDLDSLLRERGRLPVHEAVDYLLQACKGMEEAHGQGIVHRDLKPQNLFLTRRPDGTPLIKVLDFGISKLVELDSQPLSMTASSAMMGSPLYMSPEQMRSSKNVDHRSDIYSLGAVLYQLVTNAVPMPAQSIAELFEQMLTGTILRVTEHVPDIDRDFEAVVMRCLAKDPAGRYQSIGELMTALAPFREPGRGARAAPNGRAPSGGAAAAAPGVSTTLGQAAVSTPNATVLRATSRTWLWLGLGGAAALGAAAIALLSATGEPDVGSEPTAWATSAAASTLSAPLPSVVPAVDAGAPAVAPLSASAPSLASATMPAARPPTARPATTSRPRPRADKPKTPSSDPFSSPE